MHNKILFGGHGSVDNSPTGVYGDVKCNIHDMASNRREWTTEGTSNSANIGVVRGGDGESNTTYTCRRGRYDKTNSGTGISRPILYF